MSTQADCYGLDVTTASADCAKAASDYYEAVLAYRPFATWSETSARALEADGACPLARVLAADYAFCSGGGARAQALMEGLAGELASGAGEAWTWRERKYAQAWIRWVKEGDPAGCFEALAEVVATHPEDLFAVKRGSIMGLILGDGKRILSIAEVAGAKAKMDPPPRFLHGMWAFGLEQEGRYEDAEAKAREGYKFESVLGPDAWLDHGMAHALYFQGDDRLDEAVNFLKSRSSGWSHKDLHPFLYTHCWWHLSLLHCEKRQFPEALKIFEEHLWPQSLAEMRADPQVQLNAMNLLWRMDDRGQHEVTKPLWKKVVEGCRGTTLPKEDGGEKAPLQHSDLLLDILLVRAFCVQAASDAVPLEAFLRSVEEKAKEISSGSGDGAAERGETYGSVAKLVAELYRGDQLEAGLPERHSKVRQELKALQARWGAVGGSEEQRGILLEAMEGHPVVCGAPEANFDSLFR